METSSAPTVLRPQLQGPPALQASSSSKALALYFILFFFSLCPAAPPSCRIPQPVARCRWVALSRGTPVLPSGAGLEELPLLPARSPLQLHVWDSTAAKKCHRGNPAG